MRTARLKRKLLAWERYERRLEKLGQTRIYNASIHYLGVEVMEKLRKGSASGLVEVKDYSPSCGCDLDEIIWNLEEVKEDALLTADTASGKGNPGPPLA